MSQNYIITTNPSTFSERIVTISNKTFELSDISNKEILLSAGTVNFFVSHHGVSADITHGNIALNIPVILDQAIIDKTLIEKLFTNL